MNKDGLGMGHSQVNFRAYVGRSPSHLKVKNLDGAWTVKSWYTVHIFGENDRGTEPRSRTGI